MSRRGRAAGVAAALGLVLIGLIGAGCGDRPLPGRSPDPAPLGAVSLPDLSRMSEPVQRQIRARYASLMATIEAGGTSAATLATVYGEMGKLFMAAEYFDAAEACYQNAQALAPGDMRWPYYLGHVYRDRNDMPAAARALERALQLRPADLPTLVYLGEVYLAQGRPEAAEPPLRQALSLEPRLPVALFALGRAALVQEAYADAAGYLERALAQDPQASSIHHPLAMAYRGLGRLDEAGAHLRQRGDVRPGSLPDPLMFELETVLASAHYDEFRGTQALNRGEWAAAASFFRRALALAPKEPSLHLKLAEALRRSGGADEALRHYEQAIRIAPPGADPRGPGAHLGHAMVLVRLERYEDARDRLRDAVALHPGHPQLARALARLLAAAPDDRVRDARRALTMVNGLLKEHPDDSDLVETLAMALAGLRRFDEAAALQRSLIAAARRAGYDDLVPGMADNLELYEARRPARRPWTDVTMP